MAEFTKLKIGFALALLGTLFALHPLLDRTPDLGFLYLGYRLEVLHAYALTSGLLGLCVYLYAVTLLNDHPHSWSIGIYTTLDSGGDKELLRIGRGL